jgi:hypothetical protein
MRLWNISCARGPGFAFLRAVRIAMTGLEPSSKHLERRNALSIELLKLRKKHAPTFERIEQINTELKQLAGELGRSFRETDPKLGYVSVSGEKPERFDGDFPVVDVRKLQAMSDKERQALYESGVITTESKWSKPYYGQVRVELF